CVQSLEFPWTF
nr:immunoglobulin light chain junction region [Macaca mulatta]